MKENEREVRGGSAGGERERKKVKGGEREKERHTERQRDKETEKEQGKSALHE